MVRAKISTNERQSEARSLVARDKPAIAPHAREVWITGLGLVSCLGDGLDAHWRALNESEPAADTTKFAPYIAHPHAAINFASQIERKSDLRQMELGQRLAVHAAGAALQSA